MAEVTNELMFEVLRKLQSRQDGSEQTMVELHAGQNALRSDMATMQGDLSNVYGILTRIDQRLDRMERRLEPRELAEPSTPFQHET